MKPKASELMTENYRLPTDKELTATGIAPDLHRTSLLMALLAPTKIPANVNEFE